MSKTLSQMGFETHLLFVGDSAAPGHEVLGGGRLHLHRWCQWISQYHPEGAYQAEDEKLRDLNDSAPSFIVDDIVRQSLVRGKRVVILGEEWHSAEAICRVSELLSAEALEERVITLWNANDVHGFERIDWPRLARSAWITTVSKYMKHVMWNMGISALVIPNGIPRRLLHKVDERKTTLIRRFFDESLVLVKVADWHPARRWTSAVEALGRLKAGGVRTTLIAAGEPQDDETRVFEGEIVRAARALGLEVADADCSVSGLDQQIAALMTAAGADFIRVRFPVSEELARILFSVADGVLADSDHEAFGLQALEAMAVGGLVFTGCTGEDYAEPLVNAVVLETDDPDEIAEYALYLHGRDEEVKRLRRAGRATAERYVWEEVVANLVEKIEYLLRAKASGRNRFFRVPQVNWAIPFPLTPSAARSLPRGLSSANSRPGNGA